MSLAESAQTAICVRDIKPPWWAACEDEIKVAARQAFTAYELALRRGPHPKLWEAVKDSPFEEHYKETFGSYN